MKDVQSPRVQGSHVDIASYQYTVSANNLSDMHLWVYGNQWSPIRKDTARQFPKSEKQGEAIWSLPSSLLEQRGAKPLSGTAKGIWYNVTDKAERVRWSVVQNALRESPGDGFVHMTLAGAAAPPV